MVVEVDEAVAGGKTSGMDWRKRKTIVMGMMERGDDVMLKVVDDQTRGSLMPQIMDNMSVGTEIHTDELRTYSKAIPVDTYTHKIVNHSQDEYVGPMVRLPIQLRASLVT